MCATLCASKKEKIMFRIDVNNNNNNNLNALNMGFIFVVKSI